MPTKERYINLFTDYGFKKNFGEDPNKNLLLDFLNELLREAEACDKLQPSPPEPLNYSSIFCWVKG
ncbi:MAG: hypothetical protein D3916_15605 [Candidatus Electrothrix sp. MAN1_4]|nr:hypothetical protein [Candidatus Electrothrix sp. MAN1_4]